MKTILFYTAFFFYMIYTCTKKAALDKLKREGREEEAQKYIYGIVKQWANFVLNFIGAKIYIKGKEKVPEGACLFVANHQGFLDIPIILHGIDKPMGFIAKKEILKFKMVSYWMKQINCVFMDRSNIREAMKSINEGVSNLKNGHSMVIFPEGTRSKGPSIGEFKKGSMKLALKSGVPIVPIAIDGSYKLREGNKLGMIKSADVKMTICEPIYIHKLSKEEQSDIAEIVRDTIAKNITVS